MKDTSVFLHFCDKTAGSADNYRVCFRAVLNRGSVRLRAVTYLPGQDTTPLSRAQWHHWVDAAFRGLFTDWMGSIDAAVAHYPSPTAATLFDTWACGFETAIRAFIWIADILDVTKTSYLRSESFYTTKMMAHLSLDSQMRLPSQPSLSQIRAETQKVSNLAKKCPISVMHAPGTPVAVASATPVLPQKRSYSDADSTFEYPDVSVSAAFAGRPGGDRRGSPSFTCSNCGQQGHYGSNCPKTICNRCGGNGHWVRNCPQPRTPSPARTPSSLPAATSCPVTDCTSSSPHELYACPTLLARRDSEAWRRHCWVCGAANGAQHSSNCPRQRSPPRQPRAAPPAAVAPPPPAPRPVSSVATAGVPAPPIHPQRAAMVPSTTSLPFTLPGQGAAPPPTLPSPAVRPPGYGTLPPGACPRCPGTAHRLSECPLYKGCGKCGGKTHLTRNCTRP